MNIKNLEKFTDNADLIYDRIWLGSEDAAHAPLEDLKKNNITHILVCGFGLMKLYEEDLKYHQIKAIDLPVYNITKDFPSGCAFIEKALSEGTGILIHCARGRSRSPAILISYFMAKLKISFEEAHYMVKQKRSISINPSFIEQLRNWQSSSLSSQLA